MHLSPHFKPALVYKGDRFTNHFRTYNVRDSYVAHNNGGFTIANEVAPQPRGGVIYISEYPHSFNSLGTTSSGKTYSHGHIVHYRQNGSGRDSWIYSDNGGFCAPTW